MFMFNKLILTELKNKSTIMASYNSQIDNKMSKKSMFLKKRIDYDLPQNIMSMVSTWVDCYNSSINEKIKIQMHYQLDNKINDSSCLTSRMKASRSCKRSDTDSIKIQNDIFKWLAQMDDKNVDIYSEKLGSLMGWNKEYIIKTYVNNFRIMNRMKPFNPNYKTIKEDIVSRADSESQRGDKVVETEKKVVKEEKEEEEKQYTVDKNGRVIYGDSWDM